MLVGEDFKLTYHECRNMMATKRWLHPHPFYLHITVAMFFQA